MILARRNKYALPNDTTLRLRTTLNMAVALQSVHQLIMELMLRFVTCALSHSIPHKIHICTLSQTTNDFFRV
jgi:hypothetical protein